jgi:hypothetical protein
MARRILNLQEKIDDVVWKKDDGGAQCGGTRARSRRRWELRLGFEVDGEPTIADVVVKS